METTMTKVDELKERIKDVLGKAPHTCTQDATHHTMRITVAGHVKHEELEGLMKIGKTEVARSGAAVAIKVMIRKDEN